MSGLALATRETGSPVLVEAIELLACCASQRLTEPTADDPPPFVVKDLPGAWSAAASGVAEDYFFWWDYELTWRENYAEAEARLMEQCRGA